MSAETKHTPTPWTIEDDGCDYTVRGADGEFLINDTRYYPSAPTREDAEFIVRAVNALEATERLVQELESRMREVRSHVESASILLESAIIERLDRALASIADWRKL